jgi:acetyltransferase
MQAGKKVLSDAGVACYATPEQAIDAFMHLITYSRNIEVLYETPREVHLGALPDRDLIRSILHEAGASAPPDGAIVLPEHRSKEILEAYGIPVSRPQVCADQDAAVRAAQRIGYPVVAKIHSPNITHKTDVGGIALGLRDEKAVRAAFDVIVERARSARPDATIEGVTIQPMIRMRDSVELIIGAKRDPTFGAAILVGMGGVTAEIMGDHAVALPPLNERLAQRMLESLRGWKLLRGFRGAEAVDVDALVEVLIKFSYLIADFPEIAEIDINPLVCSPDGVIGLDARIVLDAQASSESARSLDHLAIRPYPEELERRAALSDGTSVLLRPIRPEDEPRWHEMFARCSAESIRSRFLSLIKRTTHKMATRYCYIDYDREMAIVAEAVENGQKKIVGVGRLVADAGGENPEYAVLVVDDWQGRRLGTLLTEYCMQIAKRRGMGQVTAITTPENMRMLGVFRRLGFHIEHERDKGVMVCEAPMEESQATV